MAYIVQAEDSEGPISKTLADRKEALATSVEWASEGRLNIKIIGDGRRYTARELARVIIEEES
jgi:hypothetical protein